MARSPSPATRLRAAISGAGFGSLSAATALTLQRGTRLITGPMDGIEVPGSVVETAPANVQLLSRSARCPPWHSAGL